MDSLDKESSVAVGLTENGFEGKTNLRSVNAFDRLVGNVSDWVNVRIEHGTTLRRARTEGEKKIIDAVAERAVALIGTDDAFACRAISTHFQGIARKQINKEAVAAIALEDLRVNPPTAEQAATGPDALSDEFMDRLEHYIETATTEDLRERWARVLSSEIRKPGTFGSKALRVTDELEQTTANLFQELCRARSRDAIVKCLAPDLLFHQKLELINAGLISADLTVNLAFSTVTQSDGNELWLLRIAPKGAIALQKSYLPVASRDNPLTDRGGTLALNVYSLTDAGKALSTILPDEREALVEPLARKLLEFANTSIMIYHSSQDWGDMQLVKTLTPEAAD